MFSDVVPSTWILLILILLWECSLLSKATRLGPRTEAIGNFTLFFTDPLEGTHCGAVQGRRAGWGSLASPGEVAGVGPSLRPRVIARQDLATSGAWQKYAYSQRDGIIWANSCQTLTKEEPYDHHHVADRTCIPQSHAHGKTTGLLGADRTSSDQCPASCATRQDAFGDGDWRQ